MANKWTEEDISFLKMAYLSEDFTTKEIATVLERSVSSVNGKVKHLGMVKKRIKVEEGYKYCSKCNSILSIDDFHKKGERHQDACKICRSIINRDLRIKKKKITHNQDVIKRCSKCNIEKKIGDFHKDSSKKDGLSSACKVCELERHKKYMYKRIEEKGW